LLLDHYIDARDQRVLFEERELGYTYKVKAKVYVSPEVVMDDGANSLLLIFEGCAIFEHPKRISQ